LLSFIRRGVLVTAAVNDWQFPREDFRCFARVTERNRERERERERESEREREREREIERDRERERVIASIAS